MSFEYKYVAAGFAGFTSAAGCWTIIGGTIYYLRIQHGFRFVPEFAWFVR